MINNLPILETQRLILREICEKDAKDMNEYAKIPYVGPEAGWEPHTTLSYTKNVIRMFNRKKYYGQLGVFAIILRENNKMIGTVELHTYTPSFKAELGYTVSPYYWGFGYAVEASKEVIKYGFEELNLKRIECMCFPENAQSKRVCEKLLFPYEGVRRKGYQLYNGRISDLISFAMTDDDYYKIKEEKLWEKK
ncbi:gCN5-related N-acetyltransferase [Coprobacillus sp. CAG:698]|nr:gCN5-related N-acetyltransferase [Coprobacillus sp. CAG:698]